MNYSELTTAIKDWCQNSETTFVAHIPDFVRTAEQRIYNAVQIPDLRKHSIGTVTLNNRYLTAPTDFLAAFAASIIAPVTGKYTVLQYRDIDWLREAYPDPAATGAPTYYGLWDDATFLLSKTPDVAYQIELHYYYKPSSIVSTSTSWLGDNFDSVLLYGAVYEAYVYLKGEPDLLERYNKLYMEGINTLAGVGDNASKVRKI